MMGGFGGPGYGVYGLIGGLFMLIFWVVLLAVVVVGIRWLVTGGAPGTGVQAREETPLEVLKRRYAAGEIDTKEFEERKKALGF